MNNRQPAIGLPRSQRIAQRTFSSIESFLHIEGASGVVLLFAATFALIWANSNFADSYFNLWHTELSIRLGQLEFSRSLHFLINDALMTLFFLVVGMEIRSEINDGALSNFKQAAVPVVAAFGGVVVPILIYLVFNYHSVRQHGWAIPMATDIAFAVGLLALLGKAVPSNVRIFLLTLAIIDDIIAVIIISIFYADGIYYGGFFITGLGMMLVWCFQLIGIGSAFAYVIPGAIVWLGILMSGAHPALAGVVLGLMTPVVSMPMREHPLNIISREINYLLTQDNGIYNKHKQFQSIRILNYAQRELLPPIVRVQKALHPWVAYAVMPLFALANAGVNLNTEIFSSSDAVSIITGVTVALVVGKPLGIFGISWVFVKLGWGKLPSQVTWMSVGLIGLLAGIGFTMSIFIATLSFDDASFLAASKLGVLMGSFISAVVGLTFGKIYYDSTEKRQRRTSSV